MRKPLSLLLIFAMLLSLFSGCTGEPNNAENTEVKEPIHPLGVLRSLTELSAVDSVEPYSEHYFYTNKLVNKDLSDAMALANTLTFSDKTKFPSKENLPAGYDPDALLEWGKSPGLNIDILHKHGFTGKGAVVAYVDQPFGPSEQYNDANVHYVNNSDNNNSMHGPAVLSLLAGKDIGTAPEAEVYFYGHAAWKGDQTTHAECLYQIIEQNEKLPPEQRITMVGFSDNIDTSEKNADAFREAAKACEEAGIMVWFCGEYGPASFLPMSDKNNPTNVVITDWWDRHAGNRVFIPDSGRTTAASGEYGNYIYWSQGGLSWTMPYVLGLYAIAIEIDPSLTQEDLRTLLKETAYEGNGGMSLVNPVGFVVAVLDGVGRGAEGETMLREAEARQKYIYAIMDTAAMTTEDLDAVGDYLASLTDGTVLVVDASYFASAQEIYTAIREDAAVRGGTITGVQIFGTPDMVPAFPIKYKVQMIDGVDDAGELLTDLFYGNLKNDPANIGKDYNVMDHFAEGWDVELVPQWRVARLPLSKGQFTAFFDKYNRFAKDTALEPMDLVNFSNPIFPISKHIDDMGTFLNRAAGKLDILNIPYRLYGNLDGQYPVTTKVLGNNTADNLSKENAAGPMELIINTHGQWNNIDRCIFVKGKEQRISLVNMENINSVLGYNPYYLDCWACLNGYGMMDNLTTTALTGQCVGMFSATAIISNNGVNCNASVEQMKRSNFYYFYYNYLKALSGGQSRSASFFTAQQAYGEAVIADSQNPIRGEGNYQFNLYNLLAYHNFGVLEPDSFQVFDANGFISQAGKSVPKHVVTKLNVLSGEESTDSSFTLTDGKPVGESVKGSFLTSDQLTSGKSVTIHSCTAQMLDNGYRRYTIELTATAGMQTRIAYTGNKTSYKLDGPEATGELQVIMFDLSEEDLSHSVTTLFEVLTDENDRHCTYLC